MDPELARDGSDVHEPRPTSFKYWLLSYEVELALGSSSD